MNPSNRRSQRWCNGLASSINCLVDLTKTLAATSVSKLPRMRRARPCKGLSRKPSTNICASARGNDLSRANRAVRSFIAACSRAKKLSCAAIRSEIALRYVTTWEKRVYDNATGLAIMRVKRQQQARSRDLYSIEKAGPSVTTHASRTRNERALANNRMQCCNRSSRDHKSNV